MFTICTSQVFLQKKKVHTFENANFLGSSTGRRKVIYKEMEVLTPHHQSIGCIFFPSNTSH
jgi:hypothetical protein